MVEHRRSSHLGRALRTEAVEEVEERDPWVGEDERWADEDRVEGRAPAEEDEEDPLAAARAVVVGLLLVVPIWLVIGAAVYAAYRVLS